MKIKTILFSGIFLLSTSAFADAGKPETLQQKHSYLTGWQVAKSLMRDKSELDIEMFTRAILDVFKDRELALTIPEMRAVQIEYKEEQTRKRAEQAKMNKEAEEKYLAENKKKEGIIALDNGIQYQVLTKGEGTKQPEKTSSVTVHYKGTLLDGTEFDSSYSRGKPATFTLNRVIKGWQEVMPLMKEGDKWKVFIPSALGYGSRGTGSTIGPDATLIFDIELIKVNS